MTRCSAFAAQILVREVEELLIVRVGMDGGHRAAMDSKRFVEDFGDGGETVCGAGGVRNDMVLRRIVGFVVHAEDEGGVRSIGRRGDDDFFHRCAKMLLRVGALGEKTGGLDDDVRADRGPVDFGRIFRLENLEALPFHGDGAFGVRDGVRQVAEDGVVLQKVCERLGIGDVIDGDELNVLVVERGAHDVASDAAEAVDADLNGHYFLRWELSRIAAVKERVTAAAAQEMLWAAWTKVNAGKIWAAIMACDEGVGTCIGFALAVRFRTRRGRPLAPSLDFSARAGVHLLFRVFLAGLSNSRIDWAARNSSRQRISASLIRTIRSCALMVLCWAGMIASLLLVLNFWPRGMLAICFACFLSFVSAAQDFSAYQSDGMLLEAGFIAMFLAPGGFRPRWGEDSRPSRASVFLLVWECFRIYFESGVAK